MKRILKFAALLLLAIPVFAQPPNPSIITVSTAPSGSCAATLPQQYVNTTGDTWSCQSVSAGTGTWAKIGSGGGSGTQWPYDSTYTLWVSGGTVYARLNADGTVPYSNADAAIVINQVLTALASTGGRIFFKQGIYPINSLTAETVTNCTNISYGIGIPAAAAGSWVQFHFEGEQGTSGLNEIPYDASLAVKQTNGVIFKVSSAALAAVAYPQFVAGIWQHPNAAAAGCTFPVYSDLANEDFFTNITMRFPSGANQRGNIGGLIPWAAESTRYKGVLADFDQTYDTIATGSAPVKGTIGSFGLASAFSFAGEIQEFQQTQSIGWYYGYDWGENVESHDSEAIYSVYPMIFGRAGTNGEYHGEQIDHFTDQENLHGPLFDTEMQQYSRVDFTAYDIEYSNPADPNWYNRQTPNAVETNAGSSYGVVKFSAVASAGAHPSAPFFSSGGANFVIFGPGNSPTVNIIPGFSAGAPAGQLASYGFTIVENPLSYGGSFAALGSGDPLPKVLSSGICEPTVGGTGDSAYYSGFGTWPNNQWSQITFLTLGSTTVNAIGLRQASGSKTKYELQVGATGITNTIYAWVSGTPHVVGSFTSAASAGDTWKFSVAGSSTAVLTAYQNTVQVYTVNDSTYAGSILTGTPGFSVYNPTDITKAQISAWAAGSL